jgi:aryl-alcohol dehydrogenase-like predicted oxidoreductase
VRYLNVGTAKRISKIGLGTWQFGSPEWAYGEQYSERTARAIVRRAVELGVTLFDTAEIYSYGHSERILGRSLGEARQSAFLATKMFPVLPSARMVRQRARASASRLGVAHLDLYQAHWPNPLVRDTALMRGMRSVQKSGLAAEIGVSNYSLHRWRSAEHALGGRVLSNQVRYSLVDRSPERELLSFAESADRVIIAFSPLAQGLLSGRYHGPSRPANPARAGSPLFHTGNLDRTRRLIGVLREVADAHSATPAQIALAWVIHRPTVAAIPGAASIEQVEHNAAAAEIRLADGEYQALLAASAPFRPAAHEPACRHRLARLPHSATSALAHPAKGTWQVAQTIRHDYRQGRRQRR